MGTRSGAIDPLSSVTSTETIDAGARVLWSIADHFAIERSSRELCSWSSATALVWERVVILQGGSTSTSLPFFLMYSQASRSTLGTHVLLSPPLTPSSFAAAVVWVFSIMSCNCLSIFVVFLCVGFGHWVHCSPFYGSVSVLCSSSFATTSSQSLLSPQ